MSQPVRSISFREDCKLWWPDYDKDPVKCLSFVKTGLRDMDIAANICKSRDVCVQAGGHVGLWPIRLAGLFKRVYTFECDPMLYDCMVKNTAKLTSINTSHHALGAFVGEVQVLAAVSAGSWRVDPKGTWRTQQTTIDAMNLDRCDAIYLDVEAYEVEALKGAAETIRRFSPVIHLEELPRAEHAIREHMTGLGYVIRAKVHNDVIYART